MDKTGKNFKCWTARHSLFGDLLFSLPILNYLELKYPNSYKYFVVAKKCAQFATLFLNHPLIDRLHILENKESLGPKDIAIRDTCQLIMETAPMCPKGFPGTTLESCWYNWYNCYEQTFIMGGFPIEEYRAMPKELQMPVLNQWFDVEKQEKTVGIFGFTSYGKDSKRSPSIEWWRNLTSLILKETDYKIYQFGGESEPYISLVDNVDVGRVMRYNSLPILEQYKLALGCDLNLNTNSGSGIALGCYGVNQITLLTNDAPNHFQNPLAFAPLNWKNNNTNIFVPGGFNNLKQEDVMKVIEERLNV